MYWYIFLSLSNLIQLYMEVQQTLQQQYAGYDERIKYLGCLCSLLLGPPLSLIAHALSHNPLVWFPHFSGLVPSFGLEKGSLMMLIFHQ